MEGFEIAVLQGAQQTLYHHLNDDTDSLMLTPWEFEELEEKKTVGKYRGIHWNLSYLSFVDNYEQRRIHWILFFSLMIVVPIQRIQLY